MKLQKGFIGACSGLYLLAEGVSAGQVPDLPEARRSVIEHYMPEGTYMLLTALSRQADASCCPVKLDNSVEAFSELGFGGLDEAEKRSIEKLFSIDDRTAAFIGNALIVHPKREIEEKIRQRTVNSGLFILRGKLKG